MKPRQAKPQSLGSIDWYLVVAVACVGLLGACITLAVLLAMDAVDFENLGAEVVGGEVADALRSVDAEALRDEILGHFERSSGKVSALARAMPAEAYSWAPGEGVMEVGEVYMHIARYNFMYLDENLGIAPPDGFDYSGIESIRDKQRVIDIHDLSVRHVMERAGALNGDQLRERTQLYGRPAKGWAVLLQLVSHMNEHVGQSVSYPRMNEIVPPWSR